MDIREKTALVIRRGNEYLMGRIIYSTELRWSLSPWDAWRTRSRENAELVAGKTGGELWLFNQVAGKARKSIWA